MAFEGTRSLAQALGGGGDLEQAAFDRETRRLIAGRSQRALLDQRIAKAFQEQEQADAIQRFRAGQPAGRDTDIVLGGLGTNFSALQTGLGKETQNTARNQALDQIGEQNLGGIDLLNALIGVSGDKLLGVGNIGTEAQGAARIGKDEALTRAADARVLASEAAAALAGTRQADINKPEVLKPAGLTKDEVDLLRNVQDVPGNFEQDNPGFFTGSSIQPGVRDEDLEQEFKIWQADKARTDKNFLNSPFAMGEFLKEKLAGEQAVAAQRQGLDEARGQLFAPPDAAIAALRANPNRAPEFNRKYGEGTAAQFLQ